jgi:DNA polymerase-3 subunit delta
LFVSPNDRVDGDLVRRVVGGWRTETTWEMLDAVASGDADQALKMLDQLLQAGEVPQALFGSMAWSLRRFAAATRIYQRMEQANRRANLGAALAEAGFRTRPPIALKQAEEQLRQIGRQRANQLFQWLLETDLALKGTHASPHRGRIALEKLILRLARQSVTAVS